MKIEQKYWSKEDGWMTLGSTLGKEVPQIVFVFGGRLEITNKEHFDAIKASYPNSRILLCSTAGEIADTRVRYDSIVVAAVFFEKTELQFSQTVITKAEESEERGKELAMSLPKKGFKPRKVIFNSFILSKRRSSSTYRISLIFNTITFNYVIIWNRRYIKVVTSCF